jgi:hypothetical protein
VSKQKTAAEVLRSEAEPNGKLFVLFIPSKTKNGKDLPAGQDQQLWADAAGDMLSAIFGGATEMPPAKGKWMNDNGKIITEEVLLVHSYARQEHAEDEKRLNMLAEFLHRMGRETDQGEVGVVIDNVFHRIRDFSLAK